MTLGPELPDSNFLISPPTGDTGVERPTIIEDKTSPPQPKPEPQKTTPTDNTTPERTEPTEETEPNPPPTIDRNRVNRLITDAIAFLKAGIIDGARTKLQEAQKLDKNNAKVKDALILISIDDTQGAIKMLEK